MMYVVVAGVALFLGYLGGCWASRQYVRDALSVPPAPPRDDDELYGCGHDVGTYGVCHECRRPRA